MKLNKGVKHPTYFAEALKFAKNQQGELEKELPKSEFFSEKNSVFLKILINVIMI